VAAGSLSTSAVAAQTPAETVDLADQGLTTGELIDPYFTEYFVNGATVEVPTGTYEWDGEGFEGATENAAVIGQSDVSLELTGDSFRNTVRAEAGTIELCNFTVHGIVSEKSHFRWETAEGATIIADGVDFPDGAVDESECRPFVDRFTFRVSTGRRSTSVTATLAVSRITESTPPHRDTTTGPVDAC